MPTQKHKRDRAITEEQVLEVLEELGDDPDLIASNLLTNMCKGPGRDCEH